MKRWNKALGTLLLLLSCTAVGVVAQEHKRVEVTTIYNPEVSPATKLVAPASIADRPDIEPDIEYGVNPDTWQIELEDHDFKPATAGYWDFNRAKRLYTKLGVGYPIASDAAIRYATGNVRVGYFGAGIEHDANFSERSTVTNVVRSMADSYDMRNRAYLHGGVIAGSQIFEVSADYNYDIYNRYAELTPTPQRLMFHDAGLKLRFGDNFADLRRLNFDVELHGGYWRHVPPSATDAIKAAPEFSVGGSVRIARAMRANVVGLRASYDMWRSKPTDYKDMRIGFAVDYARDFGFINLDASLGYMFDRVEGRAKPSHFLLPRLKLLFDVGMTALLPYVEVNTTVSQNGVSSLYGANPYLDYKASYDTLRAMPNTRSYDVSLGFTGSAASSRLAYRLYLGANFMRDQVVWYVNNIGTFGVSAGSNNRLFVGAEISYRPVGGLLLAASVYAHSNNSSAKYYVNDANLRSEVEVEYSLKRWKFYVLGDITGARKWSVDTGVEGVTSEPFTTDTTIDLRAGVSLRASRQVEIYIDGYNLLNSRIYDYAYYYRTGIGAMAGVKIDF